jgi:hypothetical protein
MDQAITDIENAFPRVIALLNALVAGNVVKSSSGIVIANLLGDLEAVIAGAQKPSTDLIGNVETLLSDLTKDGIMQGQFIEAAAKGLSDVKAFVADVQNNQVAIIRVASLFGVHGSYAFIPDESDQGKSLGLGAAPAGS